MGHKHLQRHVERAIECGEGQRARRITAVGFGTSLGAEGYPLTYNVLTWDERSSDGRRRSMRIPAMEVDSQEGTSHFMRPSERAVSCVARWSTPKRGKSLSPGKRKAGVQGTW